MPSLSHRDLTHLGMDVHKDSHSIGILRPDEEAPDVERIFYDEASLRRFLSHFGDHRVLSVCYEAGPTGYELHRLLTGMGIRCQVIFLSLTGRPAEPEPDPGVGQSGATTDRARRRRRAA